MSAHPTTHRLLQKVIFILPAILLSALLIAASLPTLHAEEEGRNLSPREDRGRYTMLETKDGIVRLDKRTGALSDCRNSGDGWKCTPLSEDETAYKPKGEQSAEGPSDIGKLKRENLRLKQRIADLEEQLARGDTAAPEKSLKLPSDEEVDEAITYMEKMIRKFRGAMQRLREDESGPPGTEL